MLLLTLNPRRPGRSRGRALAARLGHTWGPFRRVEPNGLLPQAALPGAALAVWVTLLASGVLADPGSGTPGNGAGGTPRAVLRRLNRQEYENTVRDLLGIQIELADALPPDGAAGGFDNVGQAQHISGFLMERYLEAADRALARAIANGPQPAAMKVRYPARDERDIKVATERVFLPVDDGVVLFSSSPWNAVTLWSFYPPHPGRYRFRISGRAVRTNGKPVVVRIDAGPMLMGTRNHLVGYFDVAEGEPTVIEFEDWLEARSTMRLLPYGLATAQTVDKIGAANYPGPGVCLQWIEVEGPLWHDWPPESHRRLLGNLPQRPAPTPREPDRVEVVSADPPADARRIVRALARRAWRRAVGDDEVAPYAALVDRLMADGQAFEPALRAGLAAVLVSPRFLFLDERPGRLDDFSLASRLSYFLWCTMPDDELLRLAEQGALARPDTLRAQVERLLDDQRSAAFIQSFVGQWLGLRDIDFTRPSHILYPEYDEMLKVSMVREAELFFAELVRHNLSLVNLVHSDFSLLNGRLARHYGISGIEGWAFRKVPLPPSSHRGGVITMAGVLKVTANGTNTSPVPRGAWVLDRILGLPPSRPPEGVAAIEPDIRGATTMREQLSRHRHDVTCAACHDQIDPLGFALENFDVIGGFREHYRVTGRGEPVIVDGRTMPYLKGPRVDPSGELPDGRAFSGIDELKQFLLDDKDQLARALAERLATFATGAVIAAGDRPVIDQIVERTRGGDHGVRSLIHAIVESPLFLNK